MRIAIGELKQESNTFANKPTTLADFRNWHLWLDNEVLENARGTNCEVAGFMEVCAAAGHDLFPTLAGCAISGGPVTRTTFDHLCTDLAQRLQIGQPDAILLALHGAMVVEDEDDPEGAVLATVRATVGTYVPLVVTMDLHANITRRCVSQADVIVGFKTSPHIDLYNTGARAARILVRWLAGEIRPVMRYRKIPMITPASTQVHSMPGPFRRLQEATKAAEGEGVLAASVFTVQPWLDIAEMGFATVVVTDDDARLAAAVACQLAEQAWAERQALTDVQLWEVQAAIAHALAQPCGPVVLSELADGTGAGSPGDATALLAALLQVDPPEPTLIWIFDPEAAAVAAELGVGAAIDQMVGGKLDHVHNRPVRFTGVVDYAQPASFRFQGGGYTGLEMDMGLTAILRRNHIRLLVTSKIVSTVDPALYRAVGLEPADAQIVAVKSHIQFRAGYGDLATEMLLLDTPGMSSDRLTALDYRRVPRPLFPLDADVTYRCPEEE